MYYICGYSDKKIFISNSLKKENRITFFDNLVFNNVLYCNSVFDLSIKLDNKEYNVFIIYCKNKKIIYNFLLNKKRGENVEYKNLNIFNSFIIKQTFYNMNFKIYYKILREYPYKKILFNILINILPPEIINIIFNFLKSNNIISFNIDKSKNNNVYYFSMPKILF